MTIGLIDQRATLLSFPILSLTDQSMSLAWPRSDQVLSLYPFQLKGPGIGFRTQGGLVPRDPKQSARVDREILVTPSNIKIQLFFHSGVVTRRLVNRFPPTGRGVTVRGEGTLGRLNIFLLKILANLAGPEEG